MIWDSPKSVIFLHPLRFMALIFLQSDTTNSKKSQFDKSRISRLGKLLKSLSIVTEEKFVIVLELNNKTLKFWQ